MREGFLSYQKEDMEVELIGAVNQYNLKKKDAIKATIEEAVVNAIDANATYITIKTKLIDSLGGITEDKYVDSITIEDNGDGFIEENRKSFSKLYSTHKLFLGCKGISM